MTKDNSSYDIGIYCDCDDYYARSKGSSSKSMCASALNILGALFAMLTLVLIARKEQN